MTEDPLAVHISGEILPDHLRQFLGDVGSSAPMLRPGGLGGIDIEAGADAEIPAICLAGNIRAARAGIGRHQDEAEFGGDTLGAGLDGKGLFRAGEAGEIGQDRPLLVLRLGRHEDGEAHIQPDLPAGMAVEALPAAEAGVF